MAYSNPLTIRSGLALDFTVQAANTASDAILGRSTDGTVTSFSSIPVTRVSGGGNVAESTSSVLTITGGTAAVLTSSLTIQVKVATALQSGYLSSADWVTFNSKMGTALISGRILVGSSLNVATDVDVTGDVTISNLGVTSIAAGVIVNADISNSASIAVSKLAALTASRAVVTNGSGILSVSATTATQVGYLSNLSGDIQASLNSLGITIAGHNTDGLVQSPGAGQNNYAIVWNNTGNTWTLGPVGAGGSVTGPGSSVDNAVTTWNGATGTSVQSNASSVTLDDSGNMGTLLAVTMKELHLLDSDDSHDLVIGVSSNLTADRTLSLVTGDANRTITLSGSPTLGDWFDQPVKTTADPAFVSVTVSNAGGVHILDSDSSHDLIISTTSNLTADRTLAFVTGDASRTLTINASGTVYVTGGTDVALADGGTGASLADPGADRILFWDDSAGAVTWLTVGANLTITGTTIDATGGGGSSNPFSDASALVMNDSDNTKTITLSAAGITTAANRTYSGQDFDGPLLTGYGVNTLTSPSASSQTTDILVAITDDATDEESNFRIRTEDGSNYAQIAVTKTHETGFSITAISAVISGSDGSNIYSAKADQDSFTISAYDNSNASTGRFAFSLNGIIYSVDSPSNMSRGIQYGSGRDIASWTSNTLVDVSYVLASNHVFTGTQAFRAGTASPATAPFYLQAGTLMTSPEAGAFERDANFIYFTSPTARHQITLNDATQTLTNKTISGSGNTVTNISLTTAVTGVLPIANGGTSFSSYAQGDLLYASATTTFTKLAKDTNATRYLANTGTNNNPAWAQVDLTNGVTGILPVANGGTGTSSGTSLSSLTGASGTNTISNGSFLQIWNWQSLTNTFGLHLTASGTGPSGNGHGVLFVGNSGANANASQTTFASYFQNIRTGTGSVNEALRVEASGGAVNIALNVTAGEIRTPLTAGRLALIGTNGALTTDATLLWTSNNLSIGTSASSGTIYAATYATSGGGSGNRYTSGSTNVFQMGVNSLGTYGGSVNNVNGANWHIFDFQASAYRLGMNVSGTLYVGPSSGTFGMSVTQAGVLTTTLSASVHGLTVGRGAGSISTNTAFGVSALAANTSGSLNVAVGYQALQNATDNTNNTAVGVNALNLSVSGATNNTALGYHAGQTVTTGLQNTFIGSDNSSSGGITTGSSNIIIGYQSSSNLGITSGSGNVIIGNALGSLSSSLSNNIIFASGSVGVIRMQFTSTGVWTTPYDVAVTDDTKGFVVKDGAGHYWRIDVDTIGTLSTTDLGTSI